VLVLMSRADVKILVFFGRFLITRVLGIYDLMVRSKFIFGLLISSALPAVVLEKKDSLVKALGSSRSRSGSISRRRRILTLGHIAGGRIFTEDNVMRHQAAVMLIE